MKKWDLLIICGLLLLSLISITAYKAFFYKSGSFVRVTVNGSIYATLPLYADTQLTIPSADGYNILKISDGQAKITEASCPDLICANHVSIKNLGETIVCLPNKVLIEIVGNSSDTHTDAFAY